MAYPNPQNRPNQTPPSPNGPWTQSPPNRTPLLAVLVCLLVLAVSATAGVLYLANRNDSAASASTGSAENGTPGSAQSELAKQLVLEGHTGRILWMEFTPDAKTLVTADNGHQLIVWDVTTGEQRHKINIAYDAEPDVEGKRFAFALSSDGTSVAALTGPTKAQIWSVDTGQETLTLSGHTSVITSLDFHPDGTSVAVGQESGGLTLWDVPSGTQKAEGSIYSTESVNSVTFSADGATILTHSFKGHAAAVSDAQTGAVLHRLETHTNYVYNAFFSPDQKTILTSSLDQTAIVWDAETGNQLQRFQADAEGAVFEARFSPDGSMVATGGNDDSPKLWNVATGEQVHSFGGHTGDVNDLVFNHDGTRLVTTSNDGRAIVWNTETGEMVQTLSGHKGEIAKATANTNQTILATSTSGPALYVWDFSGPTVPEFSPTDNQPTATEPPQPDTTT